MGQYKNLPNNPPFEQLRSFFSNDEKLTDFLLEYGGQRIWVSSKKWPEQKQPRPGKFTIYDICERYVADQIVEGYGGFNIDIPLARQWLCEQLLKRRVSIRRIIQTLSVCRSYVIRCKANISYPALSEKQPLSLMGSQP